MSRTLRLTATLLVLVINISLAGMAISLDQAHRELRSLKSSNEQFIKELDQANATIQLRSQEAQDPTQCKQSLGSFMIHMGLFEKIIAHVPPSVPSITIPSTIPNTAEPAYSSGKVEQTSDGYTKLSVVHPEAKPQSDQRHPVIYSQTGTDQVVRYRIDVPPGYIAILGGFLVDDTAPGVYQALGPGEYVRTVADGFALIIKSDWAKEEWDSHIDMARHNKLAITAIDPGPLK